MKLRLTKPASRDGAGAWLSLAILSFFGWWVGGGKSFCIKPNSCVKGVLQIFRSKLNILCKMHACLNQMIIDKKTPYYTLF